MQTQIFYVFVRYLLYRDRETLRLITKMTFIRNLPKLVDVSGGIVDPIEEAVVDEGDAVGLGEVSGVDALNATDGVWITFVWVGLIDDTAVDVAVDVVYCDCRVGMSKVG